MSGTTINPYRFGGQVGYRRDGTNRNYVRARHLDTGKGRWASRDPLGFDGGDSNLYKYVSNRPTVYSDGSGMILDGINVPCRGDACEDMTQNNCNAANTAACRSACAQCGGSVITMCVIDPGDDFTEQICYCHCSPCDSNQIVKNQKKVDDECKFPGGGRVDRSLCNRLQAPRDCYTLKKRAKRACSCEVAREIQNNQCYCGGNRQHKYEQEEAQYACYDCSSKARRCP